MFGRSVFGGAKALGKGLLFGGGAVAGAYGVTKVPAVQQHFGDMSEQMGKRAARGAMSEVNVGDLSEQAGKRAASGALSQMPWPIGSWKK